MMKNQARLSFLLIGVLASLAIGCQLIGRLAEQQTPAGEVFPALEATVESIIPTASGELQETEAADDSQSQPVEVLFPLPPRAENVMKLDEETVNFQVRMSLDEVMRFYQKALTEQGLVERQMLHVEAGGMFSMVFDGAANGKSVVVQGVDLADGTVNVNIRYEVV
ncbi:MAG: hypothetical protein ACOY16_02125 [Chloroflexota bacterium]